jgi:uncharacterized SAM-binding protein YcdF (DUF218 family)
MSPSGRRWLLLSGCLGFLVAVSVARQPLLRFTLSWLDVGTRPERTDVVMVLGGDVSTRPFVAAALVKLGLTHKVLLSHMVRPPHGTEIIIPPEDELSREVLVRRGVPRESIAVIGHSCAHTEAEARALRDWLQSSPEATVAVVTSGYHTRRARWIFRLVLGEFAGQVSFVSAPSDAFPAECWWRSEVGMVVVLGEYLKLVFYAFRYGYGAYWMGGLVALVVLTSLWRRRRARSSEFARPFLLLRECERTDPCGDSSASK